MTRQEGALEAVRYVLGLDVGSTAVKAVVIATATGELVWKDYRRHETRQVDMCLDFLERINADLGHPRPDELRAFVTGTGGEAICRHIGGCFVQEVNAVALAVEELHPDSGSVVELGGQDAKIIIFDRDPRTGRTRKWPSMNDKCAGGTGSVIDKIRAKLNIPLDEMSSMAYQGHTLHPVAGKCGVFAETDINSLQKQGVDKGELMASLFESLVQQNLSVLTRGRTLKPKVLLLGGPNRFIPGLRTCWRRNIAALWQERGVTLPEGLSIEESIVTPDNAEYFPALGAARYGLRETAHRPEEGRYDGVEKLQRYLESGRDRERGADGLPGLVEDDAERAAFQSAYSPPAWAPTHFQRGESVQAFLGLDGGSTSTKGVLIDLHREVIAKAYCISKGNPIEDAQQIILDLARQVEDQGACLDILGMAVTGYAKDTLKEVFLADIALVETVAHTHAAIHYYPDADVVCDVGGQDIKIIMLSEGVVRDFKLNTQCSAGNGYYLQATAESFGFAMEDYADQAFAARAMPRFGYGCAVFMQSDIVDFQRQGWRPNEILAGLAAVLPQNIWLYVCKTPNLARLGRNFVLQGGTQRNLAAVKAQVDYIKRQFEGQAVAPRVDVHEHCGECGAIGCAYEAQRLYEQEEHQSTFIGLEAVRAIAYSTTRDESTRCTFCKNHCMRTFIDIRTPGATRRLTIAPCEKGACQNTESMRAAHAEVQAIERRNPDLSALSVQELFKPVEMSNVAEPVLRPRWYDLPGRRKALERRNALAAGRDQIRIGIPRVMTMYSQAPFFMGFFQSLGVKAENVVWSDFTSEQLYKEGAKRGSVDPCFPSKLAIPHVHNLLRYKHADRPLDGIFYPMIDSVPSQLRDVHSSRTCPTTVGTVEATYAAFIKERNLFEELGIRFKKTFLNLDQPRLAAHQMAEDWADMIGLTEDEAQRAVEQGMEAMARYHETMQAHGRDVLRLLEQEDRIGVVLLARPYHNDPGINHQLSGALQKMGYPVLTYDSLPKDHQTLAAVFPNEATQTIRDVWRASYSESGSRKLWAAKFVARHPQLVPLELSNFKCGHDAPIYDTVEQIIERSGTPFFYLKDIDENRPHGSIKIRLETMAYFLQRHTAELERVRETQRLIERQLAEYEAELRREATQRTDHEAAMA